MTNRKQKNLRLDREYHDKLENLAEEWFNSKKKQGQVVERLIDMHSDQDMIGMIEEIHSEVCISSESDISTHTQTKNTTKSDLKKKIETENVTEEDLKNIKNKRGIDKAKAFRIVIKEEFNDHITKDDVREYIQNIAEYEYNGANQIANSVLNEAYSLPNVDQIVDEKSGTFDSAKDAFDVEVYQGYVWTKKDKKDYIGENMQTILNETGSSKSKFAKEIATEIREYQ
jgi:hypothetical protein